MSNIDKQALREKFEAWAEEAGALPWGHLKKQRTASGNYSIQIYTYMWHAWSACHEVLLDELESKQTFQQAFFRQSLMYDVVAEAYEEAKEQIAKDVEIKARLCTESNSLFDRLRAAEKRIAELEASHSKLRDTMATIHNTIRMDGGYTPLAAILNAAKRAYEESAAAGIQSIEGEG